MIMNKFQLISSKSSVCQVHGQDSMYAKLESSSGFSCAFRLLANRWPDERQLRGAGTVQVNELS